MASFESLTDGQRAVLQLVLRQGKSYDDLAGLLRTEATVVRARAHEAMDTLGAAATTVDADRRHEIADYLLGQQSASQRAATHEYLEGSSAARAWARAASGALAPVAGEDALPDIPAEREAVAEAFVALEKRAERQEEVQRSSQVGSVLIAAGIGLVIAIILIVVLKPGSDDDPADPVATAAPTAASPQGTTPQAPTTTPSGENFEVLAQGEMNPPQGQDSAARGQVAIVRFPQANQFRLALQARNLPPSSTRGSAYGVWFYNSAKQALFVGFPDTVVGRDGRLETVADLSPNTPNFKEVLLTRETAKEPKKPGTVILRAELVTASAQGGQGGPTQTQTTP